MRIKTENLVKIYKGRRVVDGVSLEVERGEIVGLLGPNGAGKTTSFYMVVGLVRPNGGKVYLDNRDITRFPMYYRARLGIGYLAQEPSVFRKLTVQENILLVLEMCGLNKKERLKKCDELLDELGLTKLKHEKGMVLSGGERRRTEIARALANNPAFILLDEPFTGVDPIAIEDIQTTIARLRKDKNIGIIITDHNVRATLSITDRAYIISDGKIATSGNAEDLPNDPIARKYYLGERFEM
ncbi:MAG TPA: LPS export ABC transporter ATP-binding protein [Armatimonadota bacterium]|nr:LPS export ABC transporter ATP-binding protein [Armatimonadota bacterium]HOP79476.1 LPS export ABC transporter ATP-binding protein [Armatimonadota bacterium]